MKDLIRVPASSLDRVMACAGCLRFEDIVKFEQDEDGKEGDCYEELLMKMVYGQPITDRSSKGQIFTKEMIYFANKMLPHIPKTSVYQDTTNWATERSGVAMTVRPDFYNIDESKNELEILDVKFGWGIVEPTTWQLRSGAIGVVIKLGRAFKTVKFTIVQPRPHHEDGAVRSIVIPYSELLEYKEQIEKRMASLKNNNNTELVSGGHCRYCPAGDSHVCPAKNKTFFNTIGVVMSELRQDHLNETDLSQMLDLLEAAKEQLKIHEKSLKQLAIHRIKSNKIVPNYALVDTYGHRQWLPESNAESIKFLTGFEATKTVTLSPAEFEKEHNVPEMLIQGLTKRPFGGVNLKRTDAGKKADEVFNNVKEGK